MKFSILIFILFGSVYGYAQIDSFSLRDYARPDLFRKTLEVRPDLNVSTRNGSNTTNSTLRTGGNINYYRLKNSAKVQSTLLVNSQIDIRYNAANTGTTNEKSWSLKPNMNLVYSNRKFVKDKQFIEHSPQLTLNHQYTSGDNPFNYRNINLRYNVWYGWGRIEIVNDAWNAVTLLDDLERENLTRSTIHTEDIHALADYIANIKNERVLDSRMKRIYELESLSSFLVSKGIVDQLGFRGHALLYDNWLNENFTTRQSGRALKIGINAFSNSIQTELNGTKNNTDFQGVALNVTGEKYTPISNDWQWDQIYAASYGRQYNVGYGLELAATLRLAYLPNARNTYNLSLTTNYNTYDGMETNSPQNIYRFFANASFGYTRFLSYNTRLRISAILQNENFAIARDRSMSLSGGFSIDHTIF